MIRTFHKIIFLFFCFIYSTLIFAINDQVTHLPGLKKLQQKQYAGYAAISAHKKLFYWFVTSDKKNAPIILWSNGGPGYTSIYGFFNETGPYAITPSLQLKNRKHAWNHFANYLVIEQPVNVGLSDIKGNQFDHSRAQAINDYYKTLQWFLIHHPIYQHRPIYLAGESYAGTYLPLLANKILEENKHGKEKINLSGLILISPWAAPLTQQSMDTTYALTHGFITSQEKNHIDLIYARCKKLILEKKYKHANTICGDIGSQIRSISKLHGLANIAYTENQSNALLDRYVSQHNFLKSVHAVQSQPFHCFSNSVNVYFLNDIQKSVRSVYAKLLSQHIPILIFSGLNDMKDTNFLGVGAFIQKIQWQGKEAFLNAKTKAILVKTKSNKNPIAYAQSGGGLTWVKVLNAGHMIPQDQPRIDSIVNKYVNSK